MTNPILKAALTRLATEFAELIIKQVEEILDLDVYYNDDEDLPNLIKIEENFKDGPGGRVYKLGDHTDKTTVLLQKGLIATHVYLRNVQTNLTYNLKNSGFANEGRQHWRADHFPREIRERIGRGAFTIEVSTETHHYTFKVGRSLRSRYD